MFNKLKPMKTIKNKSRKFAFLALAFIAFAAIIASSCSKKDESNNLLPQKTASLKSGSDTILPFPAEGDSASISLVTSNYVYPSSAIQQSIQGKIFVRFTVETDGSLSNISILHGLSTDCDKEAIRVIRLMPKWNPATVDGTPISFKVCYPIQLKLQ